jgi:hypothetical protein
MPNFVSFLVHLFIFFVEKLQFPHKGVWFKFLSLFCLLSSFCAPTYCIVCLCHFEKKKKRKTPNKRLFPLTTPHRTCTVMRRHHWGHPTSKQLVRHQTTPIQRSGTLSWVSLSLSIFFFPFPFYENFCF